MRDLLLVLALGCSLGTTTGCVEMADVTEDELIVDPIVEEDLDADADPEGKADTVWFTPITREYFLPSLKLRTETRKLFKSEEQWVAWFDRPSPGIDWSQNWAVFYTPGTARPDLQTPGWRSRFARVRISESGKTLSITTRLEHNGDCPYRSSRPFVTATIPKDGLAPTYVKFYRSDVTRDCD